MARLTTLLFAMWLGVTVSTVVDLEKRIIGGHECRPEERQYHVKLILTDIYRTQYVCGGSLISRQWILTAGHCFKPGCTYTAYIGGNPGPPKKVEIKDQPEIFKDDGGQSHDLMLLKLPEAVDIKPVQLPDCTDRPNIKDTVQVAGHGTTEVDSKNLKIYETSTTLHCADIKIINCQEVIDIVPIFYKAHKHEHWICARTPGVDTCEGDSGGGVVYKDRIHGVHVMSHPTLVCRVPPVFMDLCHPAYFNWITETIHLTEESVTSG